MIAGDQPGQCFHAALRIQRVDLGISAVVRHIFLDQQVAVSQCGDLCRMGDAQDLMSPCALPQHLADPSGGLAGNAAVDLIVDHCGHCIPVCQRIFDGKGDAAQLTAGGNAGQRFRGFTGVRGDVEFHAVLSVACQRPTGVVQRHAHTRHIQELQGIGNACIQLVKGFQTGVVSLAGQLTLRQLASLIDHAILFIGVDSVPMHMAAALQTPCVALFGPSKLTFWSPWQVNGEVIWAGNYGPLPNPDAIDTKTTERYLDAIPVDAVVSAARRYLQ